jgi:transposase
MCFVPQKSVEQQDLQCLHRVRSRLVACRTQLINQIRGLLAEYGIVLPQHPGQVRRGLPTVLEDAENQLTGAGSLFRNLYEELAELDEKIAAADNRIQIAFQNTRNCQRIASVLQNLTGAGQFKADDLMRSRSADSIMASEECPSSQEQAEYVYASLSRCYAKECSCIRGGSRTWQTRRADRWHARLLHRVAPIADTL